MALADAQVRANVRIRRYHDADVMVLANPTACADTMACAAAMASTDAKASADAFAEPLSMPCADL